MDLITVIISLNKVSILAFIGTLVFLGYEVWLIRKESQKKEKPLIPQFEENISVQGYAAKTYIQHESKLSSQNKILVFILIIATVLFGIISIVGLVGVSENKKTNTSTSLQKQAVDFSISRGIKIYDEQFNLLSEGDQGKIKLGTSIIIGVETIKESDIDRARIRVNKNIWASENLTSQFDTKNNMYYIRYTVASGESRLKIEAQLHSKTDGWLGE